MKNNESQAPKPKVICLTPVKNEAWILEKFLMAASLWADHIVVADQFSDDDSRKIAAKFPKVILVENPSKEFNEPERQKLLIDAARKIEGPKLLITLDADEFLTANFHESKEWEFILGVPPGTIIRFELVNLRPGCAKYWSPDNYFPWGFMDDGSEHVGEVIHSTRIPMPSNAMMVDLSEIKVLHFQYVDWARMESKHRWYQCWERLNRPERSAYEIYKQYHHMYEIKEADLKAVKGQWFDYYQSCGIDIKAVKEEGIYWWDRQVLEYFQRYSTGKFRKLDIWGADWRRLADHFHVKTIPSLGDPRNILDKAIHAWLKTGAYNAPGVMNGVIRRVLKFLRW